MQNQQLRDFNRWELFSELHQRGWRHQWVKKAFKPDPYDPHVENADRVWYTRNTKKPELRRLYMLALLKGTHVVNHFADAAELRKMCGLRPKAPRKSKTLNQELVMGIEDDIDQSLVALAAVPPSRKRKAVSGKSSRKTMRQGKKSPSSALPRAHHEYDEWGAGASSEESDAELLSEDLLCDESDSTKSAGGGDLGSRPDTTETSKPGGRGTTSPLYSPESPAEESGESKPYSAKVKGVDLSDDSADSPNRDSDNLSDKGKSPKASAKAKAKAKAAPASSSSSSSRSSSSKAKAKAKAKASSSSSSSSSSSRAKAKAKAKPKAAPENYGMYEYVDFHNSKIVFSVPLGKINGHCLHQDHQTGGGRKCHCDRGIPNNVNFCNGGQKRGRPIGLIALWLKKSGDYPCKDGEGGHAEQKHKLRALEYRDERAQARAELWSRRHEDPAINRLFSVEAQVPAALLGGTEQQLWEPDVAF